MARHAEAEPVSSGGSHHGQGQKDVPFQTKKASRKVLLHGNLDILVRKAENLPKSDHYVRVSVSGAAIARTFVIPNCKNPDWMQHFVNVPVAHRAREVYFHVKNHRVLGSQVIGAVGIPVEQLCSDKKIEGTFPILSDSGKPSKAFPALSLSIRYTPVEEVNLYHGVGHQGVPGTNFPLRRGGKVTLYQDAHVDHDGFRPDLRLDGGVQYVQRNCWRDIFEAIRQARYFIYIAGWSLSHIVRLIRDGETNSASCATDCMLGDLLKTKKQDGVRVLLLVWDDPTSKRVWRHIITVRN